MLYLIATPIGNLEDISYRAIRVLKEADYILAEDTRHSVKLLNHFDIHKKLVSYHEHNQYSKAPSIIEDLKAGKTVGLVTDAGTPGISDPGGYLVQCCQEEGLDYTIVPGPVALINALVLSGQNTNRFLFEGFLPMKKKDRKERLEGLSMETRTMLFYEAPHKLKATLKDMLPVFGGERSVSLVRELTKLHEEVLKMSLEEAGAYYENQEPRGEYVLIVAGMDERKRESLDEERRESLDWDELLQSFMKEGMSKKEAIKAVAKELKLPKRDVYQYFIEQE